MKTLFKFLKALNRVQNLLQPSSIQETKQLHKMLLWSIRAYYIYAGLLLILIKGMNYFRAEFNYLFFGILFMIQAGLLFYILQIYRRFFIISPKLKQNFILHFFFFLWLILFLFSSIEQIIGYPIFSGGILFLLTKGGNPIVTSFLANGVSLGFFFLALSASGEYLLKKIN